MSLYITGHSLVRRRFTPRVVAEFSKVIDDAYSRVKVTGQGGLTMPRLRRQVRDMSLYITGHSFVRRSFTPRVVAEFSKAIDDAYSRVKVAGQGGLTVPRLRRQVIADIGEYLREISERTAGRGSSRDIAHNAASRRSASELTTLLASRLRGGPTRCQPSRDGSGRRDDASHDMATCWWAKQYAISSTLRRAHGPARRGRLHQVREKSGAA